MKTKNNIIKICMMILAIVLAFSFSACFGGMDIDVDRYEHNPDAEGKSFTEIVASVRTSCVDVYAGTSFGQTGSAGSGVIYKEAGGYYYIITNHHVIEDKTDFYVTLLFIDGNGNETNANVSATLMGGSKKKDIAVLRITKPLLHSISVAKFIEDSDKVQVGEDVFAIGNPLGVLGGTVSKGIISAKARTTYLEEIGYMKLFQTDAATYPGSSGGALFNNEGLVIGITNSGFSQYDGLNFAIPANDAIYAAEEILKSVQIEGDGSVRQYGSVPGDSKIGISTGYAACYTAETGSATKNVVYVLDLDADSDAKGKLVSYKSFQNVSSATYFHSLVSIEYTKDGQRVSETFTSSDQAQEVFSEIVAGQTIRLTIQKVNYKVTGSGMRRTERFYLDGQTSVVEIPITQYIYSPPTA